MNPIYHPAVNRVARTLLRPFAPWLPVRLRFPVNGVISVRLPDGPVVRLEANPTSHLAKALFWGGTDGYEPDLLRIFIPLARRAETILDVGAALGYYALVAAAVNPQARIVAFEPTPGTFGYLERNVRLNAAMNVHPERLAVSDAPGQMDFFITQNPKFAGLDQLAGTSGLDAAGATRDGAPPQRVEVEVDTLDRYVSAHLDGRKVDLLKLDTEATEDRVLAGAGQVLAEHRPVVLCEVLPGRIEEALEAVFNQHRYVFTRATPQGLLRVPRLLHASDSPNDFVMIPEERLQEVQKQVPYSDL